MEGNMPTEFEDMYEYHKTIFALYDAGFSEGDDWHIGNGADDILIDPDNIKAKEIVDKPYIERYVVAHDGTRTLVEKGWIQPAVLIFESAKDAKECFGVPATCDEELFDNLIRLPGIMSASKDKIYL